MAIELHERKAGPPGGFVDVGQMLNVPKTIVIDIESLAKRLESSDDPSAADIEGMLRNVLGPNYVADHKASPIVSRHRHLRAKASLPSVWLN